MFDKNERNQTELTLFQNENVFVEYMICVLRKPFFKIIVCLDSSVDSICDVIASFRLRSFSRKLMFSLYLDRTNKGLNKD